MEDQAKTLGVVAAVGAAVGAGVALGLGLRVLAVAAALGLGAGAAIGVASVAGRRRGAVGLLPAPETQPALH